MLCNLHSEVEENADYSKNKINYFFKSLCIIVKNVGSLCETVSNRKYRIPYKQYLFCSTKVQYSVAFGVKFSL